MCAAVYSGSQIIKFEFLDIDPIGKKDVFLIASFYLTLLIEGKFLLI